MVCHPLRPNYFSCHFGLSAAFELNICCRSRNRRFYFAKTDVVFLSWE